MYHTISAMFTRAFREHMRSRPFAWARASFSGLVLLVMFTKFSENAPGLVFLGWLLGLNLVFILLGAGGFFASAITEEKEDGTLPLLLMAGAGPTSVLLGKMGTRLIEGLLLLGVQVPFALLAATLGGVRSEQILAGYLALGGFLFVSACVGLLASVIAQKQPAAVLLTYGMLGVIYLGDEVAQTLLGWTGIGSFIGGWRALSVLDRVFEVMELKFVGPVAGANLTASIVVGLAALTAARVLFLRFSSGLASDGMEDFFTRFSRPDRAIRPERAGMIAVEWKDRHFVHGGGAATRWKYGIYFLLTVIGAAVLGGTLTGFLTSLGASAVWVGVLGLFLETCIAATRMYRVEIRDNTLSALLSIPYWTIEGINTSKERACQWALFVAWKFIAGGTIYTILAGGLSGNTSGVIQGMMVLSVFLPMVALAFSPMLFVYFILLRTVLVHCSLRHAWGAVPLGIGITFGIVFGITTLTILLLPLSLFGAFVALIPIWKITTLFRRANTRRLLEIAAGQT